MIFATLGTNSAFSVTTFVVAQKQDLQVTSGSMHGIYVVAINYRKIIFISHLADNHGNIAISLRYINPISVAW